MVGWCFWPHWAYGAHGANRSAGAYWPYRFNWESGAYRPYWANRCNWPRWCGGNDCRRNNHDQSGWRLCLCDKLRHIFCRHV